MPIYGKNLKKSSSPEPIDQWPWNLVCIILYASTTKVIQIMTWVDLDPFYANVKFGHIGFCMGKSENYIYFFLNYCSLRSQSCLKNSTKWVNEVEWVSKVKVILWPWSKVTQISKLKLFFAEIVRRFGTKAHMKGLGRMGMKIYTNELGHITNMATMPIYGKNLKKSTSPEAIGRWPWNLVCSIVYASTTKVTNYDPGLTLTYFISRLSLVT